ncbi:hypothetical protein HD806DRAFT_485541 [Xylariaceae sp. AK1471]|nr:hypothetical protein HD806DRAFT_485541 [Xylariaceae sp. AK1471]
MALGDHHGDSILLGRLWNVVSESPLLSPTRSSLYRDNCQLDRPHSLAIVVITTFAHILTSRMKSFLVMMGAVALVSAQADSTGYFPGEPSCAVSDQ